MNKLTNSMLSSAAATILSLGVIQDSYARMDMASPTPQQFMQQNLLARAAVVTGSIRRQQEIFSETFAPTTKTELNITPRMAGLILGFWVDVTAVMTLGTNNALLTAWGPANFLQQVRFDDLSNNTRIQTTGWHLNAVNSAKAACPFLAARTNTGYPISYGNTMSTGIMYSIATLTTAGATSRMRFWVPLSYSEVDLRGAMWANVVNATANLKLTLATSAQACVAATADPSSAVYQFDGTGATFAVSSYTVKVQQVYYDQIPVDPKSGNQILPVADMSTLYMLNNTTLSGMVTGNDFNIPFANFRSFLSTLVIYDNQTGGAYPAAGSDINYWALQTANFTNIFKYGPDFPNMYSRLAIGDDFPLGAYYFDSRAKPINTLQYGNQQLILNPTGTVNTGANVKVGWEMFAITNTLIGAASLAGSGS